jgi:hypothetical protein
VSGFSSDDDVVFLPDCVIAVCFEMLFESVICVGCGHACWFWMDCVDRVFDLCWWMAVVHLIHLVVVIGGPGCLFGCASVGLVTGVAPGLVLGMRSVLEVAPE